MNKEQLIALGLSEEQAAKVMEGYGIMIPKARLDEKIAELKTAQDTITERDKQIKDLGKSAEGNEELKKQINDLTEANKKAAEEHAAALQKERFDTALEKALSGAKARNIKTLTPLLDLDKVKLEGKELTGLDEQLKALRESDAYLFEEEQKKEEDEPPTEPPVRRPRFSAGQQQGNNDPSDLIAAKLAKYQ
ncbi:major capsid protein [Bacillus phage Carmen17]|uniref:Major capsid protein n=1 Tax=Bacillus phage Carmen17 TaxID=2072797 RepID=A0A2I7QIR1_9CAUD|nr:head scaffolding protein [Bacillus phage Carmen17]AUR81273.1 major capsid protein [Bacillus phage Carmen17]